jgi:hypothetical protein
MFPAGPFDGLNCGCSDVYECSKNAVGLQKTANKPDRRIGFQASRRAPYVVLALAGRTCEEPARTLNTERCSRQPRLQSSCSPGQTDITLSFLPAHRGRTGRVSRADYPAIRAHSTMPGLLPERGVVSRSRSVPFSARPKCRGSGGLNCRVDPPIDQFPFPSVTPTRLSANPWFRLPNIRRPRAQRPFERTPDLTWPNVAGRPSTRRLSTIAWPIDKSSIGTPIISAVCDELSVPGWCAAGENLATGLDHQARCFLEGCI